MKIILALSIFAGIAAMEDQKCEITFHNDLDMPATINDDHIKPNQKYTLDLPDGKSISVRTASGYAPYIHSAYSLRALLVPIIRDEKKSLSCFATLSFLIHAKTNMTHDAPDNSNMKFYFLQIK